MLEGAVPHQREPRQHAVEAWLALTVPRIAEAAAATVPISLSLDIIQDIAKRAFAKESKKINIENHEDEDMSIRIEEQLPSGTSNLVWEGVLRDGVMVLKNEISSSVTLQIPIEHPLNINIFSGECTDNHRSMFTLRPHQLKNVDSIYINKDKVTLCSKKTTQYISLTPELSESEILISNRSPNRLYVRISNLCNSLSPLMLCQDIDSLEESSFITNRNNALRISVYNHNSSNVQGARPSLSDYIGSAELCSNCLYFAKTIYFDCTKVQLINCFGKTIDLSLKNLRYR